VSKAKVTINGLDRVQSYMHKLYIKANAPVLVANALYQGSEIIMTRAKKKTPVDTGFLRSTGSVDPPEVRKGRAFVNLGFEAFYALYVHEDLTAHHNNGEAKFLEKASNESAAMLQKMCARAVQQMVKP
jgi:hypothetical protein